MMSHEILKTRWSWAAMRFLRRQRTALKLPSPQRGEQWPEGPGEGKDKVPPSDGFAATFSPLGRREGIYDLIISCRNLTAVNDVVGAITQIRDALKPDGWFLGGGVWRRDAHRTAASLGRSGHRTIWCAHAACGADAGCARCGDPFATHAVCFARRG